MPARTPALEGIDVLSFQRTRARIFRPGAGHGGRFFVLAYQESTPEQFLGSLAIMTGPHLPEDRVRVCKSITLTGSDEHPGQEQVTGSLATSQPPERPVTVNQVAPVRGRGVLHWAVVVACLYLLILISLTCPVIALALYPQMKVTEAAGIYLWWPYWLWVAVMFICQLVLVVVPVRLASRRPVARRPLIIPVLASGLMMVILVVAALLTLLELQWLVGRPQLFAGWESTLLLALPCVLWVGWALFFYYLSRRQSVEGAMATQSSTLLTGSILELLVAIPTHIAARNRGECCAGISSFFGLTLGMSVMLFAFGPAVFFLFLARWRRLRSRPGSRGKPAVAGTEGYATERWQRPTSW
jgi:hypothetical protein